MSIPPYPLTEDQRALLTRKHTETKRAMLVASFVLMLWIPASLLFGNLLFDSVPALMCMFLSGTGVLVMLIGLWSMQSRDYGQDLAGDVAAVYEGPVNIQVIHGRYGKQYFVKHEGGRLMKTDYQSAQRVLEAANAVPPIPYRVIYAPHSGLPFGLEPLGDLPSTGDAPDAAPNA